MSSFLSSTRGKGRKEDECSQDLGFLSSARMLYERVRGQA